MTKNQKTICRAMRKVLVGIAPVLFLTGCADRAITLEDLTSEKLSAAETSAGETAEDLSAEGQQECQSEEIFVFVCGEVTAPGVIRLTAGSRVGDALELAGGLTESADTDYVNLAEVLQDGQKVYFPSVAEVRAGSSSAESSAVNINTADAEKLCELPGIGESKAAAIIDYRTKYGRFDKPEDLMQVSGIGQSSFERLRPYITVN